MQFRREMYDRRIERASEALEVAADISGLTPEDLLERVRSDEKRTDLMDLTLGAAARTSSQEKLRALGKVLAAGITADNETKVDATFVLERIVAEMDPPHIRALAFIAEQGRFNPGLDPGGGDSLGH